MKLSLEHDPHLNLVTGYGDGHVMINRARHDGNLIVSTSAIVPGWASHGFEQLQTEDFTAILSLQPEVVIIGTGSKLRFPAVSILRPLIDAKVGYEIMDFAAACRTYNVLASEGRKVAAGLLFDIA